MALTVISPVYGTTPSSTTHAGNGGLSLSLASAPGQPYSSSNYGLMPSSALSSSSSGIASSGLGSPGGNLSVPPPPPPPPLTMTNTPTGRGLHHQPSMRVGITSPQPVGVYIFLMHTQALFLTLLSFCILYLFDRLVGSPLRRRDSIDNRNSLTLTPVLHYRGWGSGLGGRGGGKGTFLRVAGRPSFDFKLYASHSNSRQGDRKTASHLSLILFMSSITVALNLDVRKNCIASFRSTDKIVEGACQP